MLIGPAGFARGPALSQDSVGCQAVAKNFTTSFFLTGKIVPSGVVQQSGEIVTILNAPRAASEKQLGSGNVQSWNYLFKTDEIPCRAEILQLCIKTMESSTSQDVRGSGIGGDVGRGAEHYGAITPDETKTSKAARYSSAAMAARASPSG